MSVKWGWGILFCSQSLVKIICSGPEMDKGLWALRSGRPFFERTHWALALLKTTEDFWWGDSQKGGPGTHHPTWGTEVLGQC